MSLLNAAKRSRAPAAGLAAVGILWGGFAASWPDIKIAVGASDAELGFALLFSAAGGIVSMAMAPRIGRLLGRFSLPVLCAAVAGAILLPLTAGDVRSLAMALFAVGLAVAALDVLTNVEISTREARYKTHLMGFNHAMFSFAFAAAAYGTALARKAGYGPTEILPILALFSLGLAVLTYVPKQPPPEEADEAGQRPPWLAVTLTGIILFAAFIGENATEAWSALHIERTLGAPVGEGGLGPAVLGVVMGVARLFGQVIADRVGHGRLIFGSAMLGMVGTLTIAAAGTPDIVLLGVAITALGMAVVVPSAMSILGTRVTEQARALALSRAWMIGIVGFFIGPALMGGISELFGLRVSFVVVAGIIALILPAILRLSRT